MELREVGIYFCKENELNFYDSLKNNELIHLRTYIVQEMPCIGYEKKTVGGDGSGGDGILMLHCPSMQHGVHFICSSYPYHLHLLSVLVTLCSMHQDGQYWLKAGNSRSRSRIRIFFINHYFGLDIHKFRLSLLATSACSL